jgi:hypothetical protein
VTRDRKSKEDRQYNGKHRKRQTMAYKTLHRKLKIEQHYIASAFHVDVINFVSEYQFQGTGLPSGFILYLFTTIINCWQVANFYSFYKRTTIDLKCKMSTHLMLSGYQRS